MGHRGREQGCGPMIQPKEGSPFILWVLTEDIGQISDNISQINK